MLQYHQWNFLEAILLETRTNIKDQAAQWIRIASLDSRFGSSLHIPLKADSLMQLNYMYVMQNGSFMFMSVLTFRYACLGITSKNHSFLRHQGMYIGFANSEDSCKTLHLNLYCLHICWAAILFVAGLPI